MPAADIPVPTEPRARWRATDALVAGLLLLLLAPGVPLLARVWSTVDYYAHGFVIAPIALWLALGRRRALASIPAAPDPRGRAVIGGFVAVYLVGFLTGTAMLVGLGMLGALAGCVLALGGIARLRALAFPLAYLLFLVPLPLAWVAPAITALQIVSSELATTLAAALGFPVSREGNVILLPEGRLFVAEACSGISSVVTLLPAAVLLAHVRRDRFVAAALVAAVLPIAVFWNLVRVEATILGSLRFGIERVAGSDLHELAGVLTYLLGCLSLLGVDAWALRRRSARDPAAAE
jgi:exosortase